RRLAEAFSGWRDSEQHNKVMKASRATRMGIATAYAPGSKYKVYWALVLAP
ncbi:MAG: CAP domain-containing protein, partial [Bosea sp. (in: a-proteobacteria)]